MIMRGKQRKIEREGDREKTRRGGESEMRGVTPQNAEQVAARVDYCSRNAALAAGRREGRGDKQSRR